MRLCDSVAAVLSLRCDRLDEHDKASGGRGKEGARGYARTKQLHLKRKTSFSLCFGPPSTPELES